MRSRLLFVALSATIVGLVAAPDSVGNTSVVATPPAPPFHFTAIGKVLGPTDFGATSTGFNTATADISAAVLSDGRIRLYAFVNIGQPGVGTIRSAISPDGVHFTAEPGIRVCEDTGGCGQTRVVALDGGGWRLFFTTVGGGMGSATSSDGLTFARDPGLRISNSQAGIAPPDSMTVGTVIRLPIGGYRMYFSVTSQAVGPAPGPDRILSATSPDMLNWTWIRACALGPARRHCRVPASIRSRSRTRTER